MPSKSVFYDGYRHIQNTQTNAYFAKRNCTNMILLSPFFIVLLTAITQNKMLHQCVYSYLDHDQTSERILPISTTVETTHVTCITEMRIIQQTYWVTPTIRLCNKPHFLIHLFSYFVT